jgi:primosomal protein N' (replication factor Y) (superfamily II helicase)
LLQLDREFDFFVPDGLAVEAGSRVSFQLGRAKAKHFGFVTEVVTSSEFASSELLEVLGPPVLTNEILGLARQVAKRQAVALGEVLSAAVPDFMPKIEAQLLAEPLAGGSPTPSDVEARLSAALAQLQVLLAGVAPDLTPGKHAYLSSVRPIEFQGRLWPDWALVFARAAIERLQRAESALLIVPEREESKLVISLLEILQIGDCTIEYQQKKADRYRSFRRLLDSGAQIVVGNRSALYAPAKNLSLICLFDDLDDSLRDQGSPYLHARELALMRDTDVILAANYRSPDIQRLVKIGYLQDNGSTLKPPSISYSESNTRLDAASFQLLRESLERGPLLVLLPNRGDSAAAFCGDCSQRLRCRRCGGLIWSPTKGSHECRLCHQPATSCACGSTKIRVGRPGSERTASELGRAFPGATVVEATANHKPRVRGKTIVVATPGSAPRLNEGYAAVLVLDADVWLSRETLRSEQLALRDWQEAISLLAPGGRALLAAVAPRLGKVVSLQLLREHALEQLADLSALRLPPAARVASIEGEREVVMRAAAAAEAAGAELLRLDGHEPTQGVLRFSYAQGPAVAEALKSIALTAAPRRVAGRARRGLKIVMDDQGAI